MAAWYTQAGGERAMAEALARYGFADQAAFQEAAARVRKAAEAELARRQKPQAQPKDRPTFVVDAEGKIARVLAWKAGVPTVVYPGKSGGVHPGTAPMGVAGTAYRYDLDSWRPATASDFSRQTRRGGSAKQIDLRQWRELFRQEAPAPPQPLAGAAAPTPERSPGPGAEAPAAKPAEVPPELVREAQQALARVRPYFDVLRREGQAVARAVNGTWMPGPPKDPMRLSQKVFDKRSVGDAAYGVGSPKDHVRGTMLVKNASDLAKAVRAILAAGYQVGETPATPVGRAGYRGFQFWREPEPGIRMEIQLHTAETWEMRGASHGLFKHLRNAAHLKSLPPAQRDPLLAEARRWARRWTLYWEGLGRDASDAISAASSRGMSSQAPPGRSEGSQVAPLSAETQTPGPPTAQTRPSGPREKPSLSKSESEGVLGIEAPPQASIPGASAEGQPKFPKKPSAIAATDADRRAAAEMLKNARGVGPAEGGEGRPPGPPRPPEAPAAAALARYGFADQAAFREAAARVRSIRMAAPVLYRPASGTCHETHGIRNPRWVHSFGSTGPQCSAPVLRRRGAPQTLIAQGRSGCPIRTSTSMTCTTACGAATRRHWPSSSPRTASGSGGWPAG